MTREIMTVEYTGPELPSEYDDPIEITDEMVQAALDRWRSSTSMHDARRMYSAIRSALWVIGRAPEKNYLDDLAATSPDSPS